MAKSKKTESSSADEIAKKPAVVTKKTPAKKTAPAAQAGGLPGIDTNLAAQSAARMLFARAVGNPAAPSALTHESDAFKSLKQSISKPHHGGADNLLNSTAAPGSQKSNLPFSQTNQKGHNQTFGADVNRTGVPRRTGG